MFGHKSYSPDGSKGDVWLYTIFEQGLNEALEQYIKNGNGENTLYAYYADFEDAVTQKNEEETKLKEAVKEIPLEQTHTLPAAIPLDNISVGKLLDALPAHLSSSATYKERRTVAKELLCLHNAGKATAAEMSEFGGLSKGGMAKHLPRLQRAGLIKKQPPHNYALTEKSIHILLKLFGIPKNE